MNTDPLQQNLLEILNRTISSVPYFLPEVALSVLFVLLILTDLIFKKPSNWTFPVVSLIGLLVVLFLLIEQWNMLSANVDLHLFSNMLQLNRLGVYFKIILALASIFTIYITLSPTDEREDFRTRGAFYIILTGLALGTFLMTMSSNLLMIYLSIELVSISSYILTSFRFDKNSSEASLKYLLYGAVSSGIMLYGMSFLYGFTGTLELNQDFAQSLATIHWVPLTVALLMTAGGILFKISAVPFHIWAPDVYHGAPLPVVAFFSVAPKLAGLIVLIRFISILPGIEVPQINWQLILTVVAILTMLAGNFSALWQRNAKRMLAYSSIAHGGFLLAGVVVFTSFALKALLFYAGIYLLMNFTVFILLNVLARHTGTFIISDYKGLGKKSPFLGITVLIVMIALTGLPPTAGFTSKLLIFSSVWEHYQNVNQNSLLLLLLFGLFNTVVSLFFYLKIPYFMFFKDQFNPEAQILFKNKEKIFATILIISILFLFFKSDWLLDIINSINFVF